MGQEREAKVTNTRYTVEPMARGSSYALNSYVVVDTKSTHPRRRMKCRANSKTEAEEIATLLNGADDGEVSGSRGEE